MTPNLVELQKLRLALTKAMQDLKKQTVALETALKSGGNAALATDVKTLRQAIKAADVRLLESLDKALGESNDGKRAALYDGAGKAAREFLKLLEGNARVKALERNPISPVPARAAVSKVLAPLTRALA